MTGVLTTSAQQAITMSVKGRTAPRQSNFQASAATIRQMRVSVGTSSIKPNISDNSFRMAIVRIPS
jgi:hypothetical protein